MIESVPMHGERQMARAILAIMASVLFIMLAEAGRAADLSESFTFKQSDGSEYTTTLVIKERGLGLGSSVTGSVYWGHKKNNQDSPDGKLENADWVVEKVERKDLGESEPATQIVWTITGKRKDDPQAEGTIVINCPTKLGEEKNINRVIIYGGSLGAGNLPIFSIEEPEQTAALKALEELGMIDHQSRDFTEVNDLKAKIWETELAQRNFAAGLPHCNELNGTSFYFYGRDRVLDLRDYRRSLDNLVAEGAFNSETRRPWNKQDADARWAQVQKQATADQATCAAVASLPSLRQKLKELEQRQ
jgi:hypothetical protein